MATQEATIGVTNHDPLSRASSGTSTIAEAARKALDCSIAGNAQLARVIEEATLKAVDGSIREAIAVAGLRSPTRRRRDDVSSSSTTTTASAVGNKRPRDGEDSECPFIVQCDDATMWSLMPQVSSGDASAAAAMVTQVYETSVEIHYDRDQSHADALYMCKELVRFKNEHDWGSLKRTLEWRPVPTSASGIDVSPGQQQVNAVFHHTTHTAIFIALTARSDGSYTRARTAIMRAREALMERYIMPPAITTADAGSNKAATAPSGGFVLTFYTPPTNPNWHLTPTSSGNSSTPPNATGSPPASSPPPNATPQYDLRKLLNHVRSPSFCMAMVALARVACAPGADEAHINDAIANVSGDHHIDVWSIVPHTWVSPEDAMAGVEALHTRVMKRIPPPAPESEAHLLIQSTLLRRIISTFGIQAGLELKDTEGGRFEKTSEIVQAVATFVACCEAASSPRQPSAMRISQGLKEGWEATRAAYDATKAIVLDGWKRPMHAELHKLVKSHAFVASMVVKAGSLGY